MSNISCGREMFARGRSQVVSFSQPNVSGSLDVNFRARMRNGVIVGDEEIAFVLLLIVEGSSSGCSTISQDSGNDTHFVYHWEGQNGHATNFEIVWNREADSISAAGRKYELRTGNMFVIILESGGTTKVLRSSNPVSGPGCSDPKAVLDRMRLLFPDEHRIANVKILGAK